MAGRKIGRNGRRNSPQLAAGARIAGNRTGMNGGGILAGNAIITLSGNARITGNRAVTGDGGGIYALNTDVTLAGTSVVELNRAGDLGGGIWVRADASLDFEDTAVVRQNIAANDGGGVYAEACAIVTDLVTGTNVLSNTPNDFVQPVC